MGNYHVYILQSKKNVKFYIGCTSDLNKRLCSHNNGKTKSTKPYRPWEIIYTEVFSDKNEAYKREWFLKHQKGYIEKQKILEKFKKIA